MRHVVALIFPFQPLHAKSSIDAEKGKGTLFLSCGVQRVFVRWHNDISAVAALGTIVPEQQLVLLSLCPPPAKPLQALVGYGPRAEILISCSATGWAIDLGCGSAILCAINIAKVPIEGGAMRVSEVLA